MPWYDPLVVFTHQAKDEALTKKRRRLDIGLSIIFFAIVLTYSIIEALSVYDGQSFAAACYGTAQDLPGADTALKVKHLCYTKEVSKSWQAFALKTFTCRGEHGGTFWGIPGDVAISSGSNNHGGRILNSNINNPSNGQRGTLISPEQQPEFCAKVIHSGEAEILAFVSKSMHDTCHGGGCQADVDTSKTYTKQDCSGSE